MSDVELNECFGSLFCGLETDPDRLFRLNDWYISSRAMLAECLGLADKIDLSALPSERISELASSSNSILIDETRLLGAEKAVWNILGTEIAGWREAKASNWEACLACLSRQIDALTTISDFFGERADSSLSPRAALHLMKARTELDEAAPALSLLMSGEKVLREAGGEELRRLVEFGGVRWSEEIHAISARVSTAAAHGSQALNFAGGGSTMSVAESFARAKFDLDEIWSVIASLPEWNRFEDWSSLLDSARETANAAREMLESLVPNARVDASAKQVLFASDEVAEGRSIVSRLSGSDEIGLVLGDTYQGTDTDLDRLSQLHGWGCAVSALDLPIAVRWRLLREDARDALDEARRLYEAIDEGCRGAKRSIESLASYGSFSWEDWQKQVRAISGRDLPSEIRARLEVAAGTPGSISASLVEILGAKTPNPE